MTSGPKRSIKSSIATKVFSVLAPAASSFEASSRAEDAS